MNLVLLINFFFFCRLERWLRAIPNAPPLPKRKNARICSLHFFVEDFKVFSTFKKALNDDAVPKAGLCYQPSNHSVSNTSLGGQSSQFNSPLGASFLSPCSPSPHINKDTLRRNYGKLWTESNHSFYFPTFSSQRKVMKKQSLSPEVTLLRAVFLEFLLGISLN